MHHLPCPEGHLDTAGIGQDIARTIDHNEMAGAAILLSGINPGIKAGFELGGGPVIGDCRSDRSLIQRHLPGTPIEIIRINQRLYRHRHKIRIGHISGAVGIGEPGRLHIAMGPHHPGALVMVIWQELLHHTQYLPDGKGTGTGWPHATNPQITKRRAYRAATDCAIAGEVTGTEQPRIGRMPGHLGDNILGNPAVVEGIHALIGHSLKQCRVIRVFQNMPDRPRLPLGIEEIGKGGLVIAQPFRLADAVMQPLADGKTVARQINRRLQQCAKRQGTVIPVHPLQQPQGAGRAHRTPTDEGFREVHRRALRRQEQIIARRHGGGLTSVIGIQQQIPARPMHREGATAEARGLWLDQRQYRLNGNRRIGSRATGGQRLDTGATGQRMRRHHHRL